MKRSRVRRKDQSGQSWNKQWRLGVYFTPWHRRAQTAQQTCDQTNHYTPAPVPEHPRTHTHTALIIWALWLLSLTNQSVFENLPFASPLSSKRTPEWGKSLSKHCNKEDHICPAPVWMGEDDPLKSSWQTASVYTVWPAALLTLESSFCFTYAPLAAVRTLFSIMNTYPSRSKAKSALQSKKRHRTWQKKSHTCLCIKPEADGGVCVCDRLTWPRWKHQRSWWTPSF